MQTHELLAGLQSQLGREAAARAGKRVERIRLASRSVQRQHQLTPQPLLERVRRHQRLELGHELAGCTGAQDRRRRAAAAPEAASPRARGATGRRFPRTRRRTTGRRGRGRAPRAAALGPRRGWPWPGPPARRSASSRARFPRRARSTRRPRARAGHRAGPAAWTGGRARPKRHSPPGARPTARRSADREKAGLRPPSETGRAANADGRSEVGPIDRRARGRAAPRPRIARRPRPRLQGTASPGGFDDSPSGRSEQDVHHPVQMSGCPG